jgi:hypothetical protein
MRHHYGASGYVPEDKGELPICPACGNSKIPDVQLRDLVLRAAELLRCNGDMNLWDEWSEKKRRWLKDAGMEK